MKANRMTPKERMLAACRKRVPDRVPAAPDISNYIPCRFTGKPFWDIYINENPPLWKAYLEAVKELGIDGWFIYGEPAFRYESDFYWERNTSITKYEHYWDVVDVLHTPDGPLQQKKVVQDYNPPTVVEKIVKDIKKDFSRFKHLYARAVGFESTLFEYQKRELGELGIMCARISVPGFPAYLGSFQGNLESLTYAYYDYPELFEELRQLHHNQAVSKATLIAESGIVESVLLGMSGGISLQSPELFDKLALPTIKAVTAILHEAGVVTGLHSCGKEYHIVKRCALETDLDYINPVEVPPMGDCNLADLKREFGGRIALMGNLHTSTIMLHGTPDDVRRESIKAIADAGMDGGFVLSTGDQCGFHTPLENLYEMVRTVEDIGCYPLDKGRLAQELSKVNKNKR